jgi:hypothetical protein
VPALVEIKIVVKDDGNGVWSFQHQNPRCAVEWKAFAKDDDLPETILLPA